MDRNPRIFCFLVLTLVFLAACSNKPAADQSKKAVQLDKIQGKAQVLQDTSGTTDAALSAGGSAAYLWVGTKRYRLFFRTPAELVHGDEYIVEGINAQKVIDDLGDPDKGANGYPLLESCQRVVKSAWTNLAFDAVDAQAQLLRNAVKRYPARPVFLVVRIRAATSAERTTSTADMKKSEDKSIKQISVPAEKQQALLLEGAASRTAPLWQPAGGTAKCKVVVDTEGKISELNTGAQLCESVDWSTFRYKPMIQAGKPVKVDTEVEVKFEPLK